MILVVLKSIGKKKTVPLNTAGHMDPANMKVKNVIAKHEVIKIMQHWMIGKEAELSTCFDTVSRISVNNLGRLIVV